MNQKVVIPLLELSGSTPDEIIAGKTDLVKIHDILLANKI